VLKEKPRFKNKHEGKVTVKLYLKKERNTDIGVDEIKEIIISHMQDTIEDHKRQGESNDNVGTSEEHTENKN
jgi:20S proteasome alpha/beta subunit